MLLGGGEENKHIHFSAELQILLHWPVPHWLLHQFLSWTIQLQSSNWHRKGVAWLLK